MIDKEFGTKELYWAALKATSQVEVDGRVVEPGEIIAEFNDIQISTIDEVKKHWVAEGGYGNQGWVFWDDTKEVVFNFSQGIFTPTQLALTSNSDIYKRDKELIDIPKTEYLESNSEGIITLERVPVHQLFIYDAATGERIKPLALKGKDVKIADGYKNTICHYYFNLNTDNTIIRIGTRLIKGYLRLEGKTRLKDDKTGKNVTGFIVIPQLKLMSDLSMRLGKDVAPMVANFTGVGYPVGNRGRKTVCELAILDRDIDKVF